MTAAITRARTLSENRLNTIRVGLSNLEGLPHDVTVVTCGSYARREASQSSDIDFFAISPREDLATTSPAGTAVQKLWPRGIVDTIQGIVPIDPAEGGAFAKVVPRDELVRNIGGEDDSNQKITRRILLLLEGEWLTNENNFRKLRREILEYYISDGMTDHQLALFLLNDVIRYYRTIAVDYEFKTSELANPKPWGIRNIKLIFQENYYTRVAYLV
jgi:Nucleotidyltransferase domain